MNPYSLNMKEHLYEDKVLRYRGLITGTLLCERTYHAGTGDVS